jgi:hypothetical protein
MASAQLYKAFRDAGMPRLGWRAVARNVRWIVLNVPDLVRSPARRGRWIRRTVTQLGKVRGSFRYRVLYL